MKAIKQLRSRSVTEAVGVIFFAVLGIWLYFNNDTIDSTRASSKPRQTISASWDDLLSQYSENELSFAAKYKHVNFSMRGAVVSVVAGGIQPGVFVASNQGTRYESTFLDSDSPRLAQLKTGDTIAFTCNTFESGVMMQDCHLDSVAKGDSP